MFKTTCAKCKMTGYPEIEPADGRAISMVRCAHCGHKLGELEWCDV